MRPRLMPLKRQQCGLTLVEMLVGVAIGLVVVAASAKLVAGQVAEGRRLLLEARLMQDMRTAADVVTRDLRRAGHWGDAAAGVWQAGATGALTNPYAALPPASAASDAITFAYSRDATENHMLDSNERFGFRLRNGVLEMLIGAASWQALTDAGTLTVTAFSITPNVQRLSLAAYCPRGCTGANCPQQELRSLAVQLRGQALVDTALTRTVRSEVRLRNDVVTGTCPA